VLLHVLNKTTILNISPNDLCFVDTTMLMLIISTKLLSVLICYSCSLTVSDCFSVYYL